MKKYILILAILLLSGCADTIILEEIIEMEKVGFLHGLWHGAIIIFSFIGTLISDDIAIYAIYNNGGWYDFGFLLGVIFFGLLIFD